jgi:hypothetical protein
LEIRSDPLALVDYLQTEEAAVAVRFATIKKLYDGKEPLESFRDLLGVPGLCLVANGVFQTEGRFYAGDLSSKRLFCDEMAKSSPDPRVEAKYREQAEALKRRLPYRDPSGISYGLRQGWIPEGYLREFLRERRFLKGRDPGSFMQFSLDPFSQDLRRYLNNRAIAAKGEQRYDHFRRLEALEADFDDWLHRHPDALSLAARYNDRFNSYVPVPYEDGPLDIDEFLSGEIALHPYQREEVRRLAAEGKGICAFGVGLGKTMIALGLHAWGVKHGLFKRTLIVVPSSVMGNWYRECGRFFRPEVLESEVLACGVARGGPHAGTYRPQDAAQDIRAAAGGGPSLLIMSKEKFGDLGLSLGNREAFADYVGPLSPGLKRDLRAYVEQGLQEGMAARGGGAKDGFPLLEELGVDNLIVDEAHVYKNSLKGSSMSARIAYLSNPPVAKKALDAVAKAHYLRQENDGRGTYGLTATPVTNSPFEIFNMLALVTDLSAFEAMGVESIDDVIKVFGRLGPVTMQRVSGETEDCEALLGFVNLDGIRGVFRRHVHFEGEGPKEGNSFHCPEKREHEEFVPLTPEQEELYQGLREEALELERGIRQGGDDPRRGDAGGPGHILSIIRDMDRLTVDIDSYRRECGFLLRGVPGEDVRAFLDRLRGDASYEGLRHAALPDGAVLLTVPEGSAPRLEKALPSSWVQGGKVSHPLNPKYERLLARMLGYHRAGGKQLVFTEEKAQHRKLRRIIAQGLGLPERRVGIINADESAGPALERTIRDYNKGDVAVVVANRKAELGVNLQEGTSAIHHLTLPWTPASVEQRNGRGIRQGNEAEEVQVHYYFGERTFDSYRRTVLEMKAGWLSELLGGDAPTMPNAEMPDMEEILDMLSGDEGEAQARRLARQRAQEELRLKREAEGLFRTLRSLTEENAKHRRFGRRAEALRKQFEADLAQRIGSYREREEKERRRLEGEEDRWAEALRYGGAISGLPPQERERRARELREKLEALRDDKETMLGASQRRMEALKQELRGVEPYGGEYASIQSKMRFLKSTMGSMELEYLRKASAIQRQIKTELNLPAIPPPPPPRREAPAPDWRKEEERQRGVFEQRMKDDLEAERERYQSFLGRAMDHLRAAERAGRLPFDISLTDSLGSFLLAPDNTPIFRGERYFVSRGGRHGALEILEVFPDEPSVKIRFHDPTEGVSIKHLKAEAVTKLERLGEPPKGAPAAYGLLARVEGEGRLHLQKWLPFLELDPARGRVSARANALEVSFGEGDPPDPRSVPVWPEPHDPKFRLELAKAWRLAQQRAKSEARARARAEARALAKERRQALAGTGKGKEAAARDKGADKAKEAPAKAAFVLTDALMVDLFGEGYEAVVAEALREASRKA